MFCRFCGEKIDDDAVFCSKCGVRVEGVNGDMAEKIESVAPAGESTEPQYSFGYALNGETTERNNGAVGACPNKPSKAVKGVLLSGYIAGLLGVIEFLVLSIIGGAVYGDVLLFGSFEFTICSSIGLVLVAIGVISVSIRFILERKYASDRLNVLTAKRVLLIVLCFVCYTTFVWGFVDLGHRYSYYSSDGLDGDIWNGKTVNFVALYRECGCLPPWAKYDNDYLKIDTNPYDYDTDNTESTTYLAVAINAIKIIHSVLDLPTYLYDKMLNTTSNDGRQTYSGLKVDVVWFYHPNYGLEVWYRQKSR